MKDNIKNLFKPFLLFLLLLFIVHPMFAESTNLTNLTDSTNSTDMTENFQVDENLFDDNSFEVVSNIVQTNAVEDQESFGVSGGLRFRVGEDFPRDFVLGNTNSDANVVSSSLYGYVLADIRLKSGIKGFANLYLNYNPYGDLTVQHFQTTNGSNLTLLQTNFVSFGAKELFVDLNLDKKVFFRFGKQVLQWGTAYFWNPTDLVNVDRKTFTDLSRSLEGNYGFKMQIPFGTLVNLYGYLNVGGSTQAEKLALSLKSEFLIGTTEIALSSRVKKNEHPIFGLDFSSSLFDWNLYGEVSLADWDPNPTVEFVTTNIVMINITNNLTNLISTNMEIPQEVRITNQWTPKVCIGVSRFFDFMDVENRISLTLEAFYNAAGYTNLNLDSSIHRDTFLYGGYYHPNEMGQWYGAFFLSVNELVWNKLTGSLNGIANWSDGSGMLSLGLTASPIDHFSLSWSLTGAIGEDNREYTLSGRGLSTLLSAELIF